MSCQKFLIKPLKLLSFQFLTRICVRSQFNSVTYLSAFSISNKKSTLFTKIFYRSVPLISVHTSNKCYESGLPEEDPSKPLAKLTFIKVDGEEIEIQGRVGLTVMQAAVKNHLPIEAACDGQLACTTCHVYVEECIKNGATTDEANNEYLKNKTIEEEDMLDSASFVKPNSRLACQLIISPDCENARFRLPAATINFSVDKKKEEQNR